MRQRISRRRRYPYTAAKHVKRGFGAKKTVLFLRAAMGLCVLAIVVFAAILFGDSREYSEGDAVYEEARSMLRNKSDAANGTNEEASGSIGQSAAVDFAALRAVNDDVVGWMFAEGRDIDYPVVRGEDNEYYLTHLFNRKRNKLGTLFVDYRNSGDFSDKNTIIYGHNMKDGSMFASLSKYKDQQYYESFPAMALYTPAGDFTVEFFAGIVADGDYEFVRFEFRDDADFADYINALKESSAFESGTIVNPDDNIVTLYTCSNEFKNARYALFGKLIQN